MMMGTRHQGEESVSLPRSQRIFRRIKEIKASIAGIFKKRGRTTSRGRTVSDLRREAVQQRREGKRPAAQRTWAQYGRLPVPQELRGPVDRKPLPPPPEHRLRRRPAFRRVRDGGYHCRGVPYEQRPATAGKAPYQQRPLPHPPTSQAPQFRKGNSRGLGPPLVYRQMPRNAPGPGYPAPRVPRELRINTTLSPSMREASSPLSPPQNVSRSVSGRQMPHGVTPGSLGERIFEPADVPLKGNGRALGAHRSGVRVASASGPQSLDEIVNSRAPKAQERSYVSRARPSFLNIDPGTPPREVHPALRNSTPPESKNHLAHKGQHASDGRYPGQTRVPAQDSDSSLRAIPRRHSHRERSPPQGTTPRPSSLPHHHLEPPGMRLSAPMHPHTVHAVANWLATNLSHVPYVITSLSALSMYGYTRYLPAHLSILCPDHCRNVVTGWAVATGVALYPRQRGFGLQLPGEDGQVRRVRVHFVNADVFSGFRTAPGKRVLSLPSLIDVLAEEFMDMTGERVGQKRVVVGGAIYWAVGLMIELGARVEVGEVRHVLNPLFMEPFVCTFPGSREAFVRAGLVPAQGACEQWILGSMQGGSWKADTRRCESPEEVPFLLSQQR